MVYLALPLMLTLQPACTGTYLRWLSPLGTWEGWLFGGDVDTKTDVVDATDISTADSRAQVAVRRAGLDTLTVRTGDLSEAQHAALSTILDSPQVYRQYVDGRREPVYVLPSARATRTSSAARHTFEVEIEPGRRNTITN